MTQNNLSLLGSTTLSNVPLAGIAAAPMASTAAAKYKLPPLTRAYDVSNGKLVNNLNDLHNPQGGSDPELMRQWHLKQLGDIGEVWRDFTGKGVSVGVYDSGIQKAHWDLDANYDSSKHVVIDGVVIDGEVTAKLDDSNAPHGTSVAGLIAAERNGRGGVGVAYDSKVTSVNIFDPDLPIWINGFNGAAIYSALNQANRFDVVNHSWGGRGGRGGYGTEASRSNPDSFSAKLAGTYRFAAETGRDGLGTISVVAAGNDSVNGQEASGITDRHAVAVGAYRQVDGVSSFYSNFGPHLLVSAPSNDYAVVGGTGQVTTDLLGGRGYNTTIDPSTGDYTDTFGGTSGAAPVVSGVVALMLDANENLGWRDVKDILAASAKMPVAFGTGQVAIGVIAPSLTYLPGRVEVSLNESRFRLAGQDANWNGGAMHYSNDYGYGAVDAYNATRMAEVWGLFGASKTSANEMKVSVEKAVGLTAIGSDILPNKASFAGGFIDEPTRFTFEVTQGMNVEHIDLTLKYSNAIKIFLEDGSVFADVFYKMFLSQIKLIAPDGTESFFAQTGPLGTITPGSNSFTFGLSNFRGIESAGTWTLEFASNNINDYVERGIVFDIKNNLTIDSLKMDMFGSAVTNDDVYTYTNEFFDMVAIRGEAGRKVLNDTDGGTDWINAAAVSADIALSLVGGQSTTFDGERAFTIGRSSVIEGAVTGDGNDTLIGSRFDNYLFGMRGNDMLNGGAGNDTLFGGTGNDRFLFDNRGTSGKDTVLDWSRGDMIATQTALRGQGGNGTVTVANNAMLLLDGLLTGDTVLLSQNGGAVLQAQGQKDGYFWYSYVSGANLDPNEVIREVSFQPERTAAGSVDAIAASSPVLGIADAGAAFAALGGDHGSFYLYDAMAGSMSGGVLLHA